jgi:hypothetical protein
MAFAKTYIRKGLSVVSLAIQQRLTSIKCKTYIKGGPGSGNFGHEGRPGEVGGSGGGGETPFSSGSISSDEYLGGGVTAPLLVRIEGNGQGVFKSEEVEKEALVDFRKEYSHVAELEKCSMVNREVMTSEIDKTLGVNLVPETVIKEGLDDAGRGSCQQWVDNIACADKGEHAFTKIYQVEDRQGKAVLKQEVVKAAVFDDLIANADRHTGNIGVDKATGKIHLIDNGLALGHTPEVSFNGRFIDVGGAKFLGQVGFDSEDFRISRTYMSAAKEMGTRVADNKDKLDSIFKTYGLPKNEVKAFYDRAVAMQKGKFYEYTNTHDT